MYAWENKRFAWLKKFCRVKLFVWHLPPLSAASSLCLSIPFFYPSVSRFSFHPSLFPPSMKMSNSCPSSDGQLWLNKSETEKESERGGGRIWPPQLWRKDFITSCQISSCCRLRISEAGPERDCLRMCVCWKLRGNTQRCFWEDLNSKFIII